MSTFGLTKLGAELWIARRLGLPALFDGVTDDESRKERVRKAIVDLHVEHLCAGSRRGKIETWGALFKRVYGESVQPPKRSEAA